MEEREFCYVETHLTNHCNLNCAHCTHYAPLADPWFKDINEYVKEIAQLAYVARNTLQEIRLLGGEPLLHPQVADFVYITRQAFPFVRLEVVTNGILLPQMPESFFNVINECNASIYLSDYGLSENIKSTLENKVNHYRIGEKDHFIKPGLDLHGSDKADNFKQCFDAFESVCYNLRDGYLYHCPTEAYYDIFAKYFNITDYPKEGLNIFEATAEDIKKYINAPSEFCKYCRLENKPRIQFHLSKKKASEWLA